MKRALFILAAAALSLTACADDGGSIGNTSRYNATALSTNQQGSHYLVYRAVDALVSRAKDHLDSTNPILATSLSNVNDLAQSSTFGRLVGDQAATRLVQLGMVVRDIRLAKSLEVRPGTGELILSRDVRRIVHNYKAQAVLAGTYAIGGQQIYVDLRLISPTSERILSAVDFVVPLDKDTRKLVGESDEG